MEKSVSNKMIENLLHEKKNRKKWLAIFLCLALVVALVTTAALKLTGIAMTNELTMLNCPVEVHEHTDECFAGEENLICGHADFVVHTHSLDCYYSDVLVCKLPEIEAHEHTEDCYGEEEYTVCGFTVSEESADEAHIHTDECYTDQGELICDLSETDTDETVSKHVHTDECYEVREAMICGKDEVILHTHTVECYKEAVFDENGIMIALTSELPEDVEISDTWTRDMIPACGLLQIEEHIHGAGCMETIKLTPDEADAYLESIGVDKTEDSDNSDNWNGTMESAGCKDIGNDDGTKTVQEQLTWNVTINFPNDEKWTDFTYTDSFRQTMTGWILPKNGEKAWVEDHPIHHYQVLSRLSKELNDALSFSLEQAGLINDLAYTVVYKDQSGNEITDGNAQAAYFEINFQREAGQNLFGQAIGFSYTSLVDTDEFVDNTNYNISSDFTLQDFTGTGSFSFNYTNDVSNASETGDISVQNIWLDVKGNPVTDEVTEEAKIFLKQYAFKGGIYLTEKPEDAGAWCKLTISIRGNAANGRRDVSIKALNEETLGTNIATIWIPENSQVYLSANSPDADEYTEITSEDETITGGSGNYSFNVEDTSSYELDISANNDVNNYFVNVIGKAPADFIPSGSFSKYGETVTLNGVDDDWNHTWTQVPMDDGNNTQYVYTVEETEVPDGYYATVNNNGDGDFTVTNRMSMELGKITVEISWIDSDGYPMAIHPDFAEVELQKKVMNTNAENGDAEYEWVTVENSSISLPDEYGRWTASWKDLEDGEYRVVEKDVDGYEGFYYYTYYDSEGNEYSNWDNLPGNSGFVNVINIEKMADGSKIVVVKEWEYEDGTPDTDHPDSVQVTIKRARMAPNDEDEPTTEPTTEPSTDPDTSEPDTSETTTSESTTSESTTSETTTSETTTSESTTSETTTSDKGTTKPGTSETVTSKTDNPYTGDASNLLIYVVVALISGALLVVLIIYGLKHRNHRKGKEENEEGIDE